MNMTEGEIVRMYKAAANPREQIKILADMNECEPQQIQMILYNNGCKEAVTKHKKQGRPPKSTYDESLKPEAVAEKEPDMSVYDEEKNPYCKVEVEEEITAPVVNEEPPKLEIPAIVFDAVKDRIDELERQVWSISDDLSRILEKERALRIWLEGVKRHE